MIRLSNIFLTPVIICVFNSVVFAQDYSKLKGNIYGNIKECTELKNSIRINVKSDPERFICNHYFDTTTNKHLLWMAKELREDTLYKYKILDLITFDLIPGDNFILIGSNENKDDSKIKNFVVGYICCHKRNEEWKSKSEKILKAWAFNKLTNEFEVLNQKNMYSFNEGFYY